jgi:hypothetical protein
LSTHVPRRIAETTPSGTATSTQMTTAPSVSEIVAGRRSTSSEPTAA